MEILISTSTSKPIYEQITSQIKAQIMSGALQPGEADTVLIAGMGGNLTKRILAEGKEVLETVKELVLQPQSEIWKVRRWLRENGWKIVCENIVYDEGKYYSHVPGSAGLSGILFSERTAVWEKRPSALSGCNGGISAEAAGTCPEDSGRASPEDRRGGGASDSETKRGAFGRNPVPGTESAGV